MRIAVAGLWHLGTVTAACLADAGHEVLGFDEDAAAINALRRGEPPLFEPGLEALVRKGIEHGKLRFSAERRDVSSAELVWIAYDTPVDDNDQADAESVVSSVAALFPFLQPGALALISSQLPAGSTRRLEGLYREACPGGTATFGYSPENLRLGKAIEAFTHPERIVVGLRFAVDRPRLENVLSAFTKNIEWVRVESAEMTKHALNAFLATSVTFINEVAAICERVGADAREVERGLKADVRIGPRAYLRPGPAFAGGTLARDVSFLMELGGRQQLPTHLLAAVRASNEAHKDWPRRRLREALGDLRGKTVAVLGLTYKPGTDTLRRSSAVETCRWLHEQGALVNAYDPAVKQLPEALRASINLRASAAEALRGADAALIATEWPEFAALKAEEVVQAMPRPLVLDPGGFLEKNVGQDARIRYLTVGRP
ncbi:MAG: nucleotide sugar dehydrogenase [Planctomycetota bacterium]|nr:nucleotide sugar dehydrogenase [Planctomycetota bacterium]